MNPLHFFPPGFPPTVHTRPQSPSSLLSPSPSKTSIFHAFVCPPCAAATEGRAQCLLLRRHPLEERDAWVLITAHVAQDRHPPSLIHWRRCKSLIHHPPDLIHVLPPSSPTTIGDDWFPAGFLWRSSVPAEVLRAVGFALLKRADRQDSGEGHGCLVLLVMCSLWFFY